MERQRHPSWGFDDWRKFIETWQRAKGLAEVCEALGLTEHRATQRALVMRKKGVCLKRFQRGGGKMSDEEVNTLKAVARKEMAALLESTIKKPTAPPMTPARRF